MRARASAASAVPGHDGHQMIGDQQVGTDAAVHMAQRHLPQMRLDDVVAEFAQPVGDGHADQFLVIDEQDRAPARCLGRRWHRADYEWFRRDRDRRVNSATVPDPTALRSASRPPDCAARPRTMDRPSPVPEPTPLVVNYGSMTRASLASSIPTAVVGNLRVGCASRSAGQPEHRFRRRRSTRPNDRQAGPCR